MAELVVRLHQEVFPGEPYDYIIRRFDAVADMFDGRYEGFLPMDTAYHDIEHTLQATLCLARLLVNRQHAGDAPPIDENDFNMALIAILLHDMGYLKENGDEEGTGAKYTHVHETRSCRHARAYLSARDWPEESIEAVEKLISCTGPRANISGIRFTSRKEKLLGQAVCTADFVGQLSDPGYVQKLPALYNEFRESFEFQGLDSAEFPYASFEDMFNRTPDFYDAFVKPHLEINCDNLWQFLRDPETAETSYLDAIEANMERIRRMTGQTV